MRAWPPVRRRKRRKSPKNVLSEILGLLCVEQNVRNIETCTFRYSGTPVRRTRRRRSQKMHFRDFWDSFAQNRTSEISKMHFQEFLDSCAQNKTSEISKNALSGILGLLGAEQFVGNLKKCTFGNSGAPVRRTRRRQSKNNALS